jgi:hypothetical protein
MKPRNGKLISWSLIPAAVLLASGCNFSLTTDTLTTPQIIIVTATPQSRPGETQEPAPPSTAEPALTFTPTLELTPTHTATATVAPATMTAGQALSCVKGPHWILYEWVAGIAEGETVTLLAKAAEDWEEYYYVRKSNGTECWAFGGSSTKTGNPALLPLREAPPLPEIEFTITNQTGLIIVDVFIREKDEAAWGADRLGAGNIPVGGTFSLTLTAGFYDVQINDLSHNPLYEKHDRPIGSDANYRSLAVNEKLEFYILNNFAFDLCLFKFRQVGGDWEDLHTAADGAIAPGEKAIFNLLPAFYDVQIYRCTGPMAHSGVGVYFGPAIPGYNAP